MKITEHVTVAFVVSLHLNEAEARALDFIASFGSATVSDILLAKLGKSPHEEGLRSLLSVARDVLPSRLSQVDRARQALQKT